MSWKTKISDDQFPRHLQSFAHFVRHFQTQPFYSGAICMQSLFEPRESRSNERNPQQNWFGIQTIQTNINTGFHVTADSLTSESLAGINTFHQKCHQFRDTIWYFGWHPGWSIGTVLFWNQFVLQIRAHPLSSSFEQWVIGAPWDKFKSNLWFNGTFVITYQTNLVLDIWSCC